MPRCGRARPTDPDAGRAHLHVVRPRLPGGRRHPGAAARRGHPRRWTPARGESRQCWTTPCWPTPGRWPRSTPAACCAPRPPPVLRSVGGPRAPSRPASERLRGHRPRALVLVRRPGTSGAAAALLTALLGPACPVPVVTADAVPSWAGRWTSCGRTPRTPRTPTSPTAWSAPCAGRRGGALRAARRPGGGGRSGPGAPGRAAHPRAAWGWICRARLAVGLAVVAALDLLPRRSDPGLDVLADQLDAEAERNQPGHEPFMNPAKTLALRLDGHTPLLWGTDAAAAGRRRPRRGRARRARRGGRPRRRHRPRGSGDRAAPRAGRGRPRARHLPRPLRRRPRQPAAAPPRLVLLATGRRRARADGAAAHRPRSGRPPTCCTPSRRCPRGTRHAALLRAAVLASRLDVAAVYLGLATRTIEPA